MPPATSAIASIDESAPPESERTVYKRVPADLLQRARQAALSDYPPPSFDDSDRTAIFVPPRELLTQSLRLQSPEAESHDRKTPVAEPPNFLRDPAPPASRVAPAISVEAAAPLVTTPLTHRSDAPPPFAPANALDAQNRSVDSAPPKRRRVFGLVACLLVLLLLAAGFVYMHSGRSLLMPSSATKNG